MIYCLDGKIIKKYADRAVISCGGVGFLVNLPTPVVADIGEPGDSAQLFTYMDVKEDSLELYGFSTESQQACFKTLITVSGVGTKTALGILSLYTPDKIAIAVASGDHNAFCACPGIGPKLGQRIVLELKGKLGSVISGDDAPVSSNGAAAEAAAALVAMGFTRAEAASALAGMPDTLDAGELIRAALQSYDKRKG